MAAAQPLDPTVARELLLRCFERANGARFAAQERALGIDGGGRAQRSGMEALVRMAFSVVDGSYDHPTRLSLTRVVNLLAERSLEWGASEDVVFECHCLLMQKVARVEEGAS